jgi:hypothetical protein
MCQYIMLMDHFCVRSRVVEERVEVSVIVHPSHPRWVPDCTAKLVCQLWMREAVIQVLGVGFTFGRQTTCDCFNTPRPGEDGLFRMVRPL